MALILKVSGEGMEGRIVSVRSILLREVNTNFLLAGDPKRVFQTKYSWGQYTARRLWTYSEPRVTVRSPACSR